MGTSGRRSHGFHPLQTELYIEDWIGLKTLDEAGKVEFEYFKVPGGHLAITESEMEKYIVPYLGDSSVDKPVDKSSSGCLWWSRQICPAMGSLVSLMGLSFTWLYSCL
ncbi:hypothetical protein AKJ16_DCAP17030 [Drosera capensis]